MWFQKMNIWFVWFETSYRGEKVGCHDCEEWTDSGKVKIGLELLVESANHDSQLESKGVTHDKYKLCKFHLSHICLKIFFIWTNDRKRCT